MLTLLALITTLQALRAAEPELRADTACKYGSAACNPCIPNVEKQFTWLPAHPGGKYFFNDGRGIKLPPFDLSTQRSKIGAHVQGFARIPGVEGENWFAYSRSDSGDTAGGSGIVLAQLTDMRGRGGEALEPFAGINGSAKFYYPMMGSDHAGGIQTLGRALAIGAECTSEGDCVNRPAWVDFIDASDPAHVKTLNRLVLDGSRGEPEQMAPHRPNAAFAAVARLEDQRVLMFVGGSRTESGWFYVSGGSALSRDTQWNFIQFFDKKDVLPSPRTWDVSYQNMSFVSECGTGNLYLVGSGSKRITRRLDLFKVHALQDQVRLERIEAHSLSLNAPLHCHPRGGASIHVTPSGKMVFYCSAQLGELLRPRHRFSEYTTLLKP